MGKKHAPPSSLLDLGGDDESGGPAKKVRARRDSKVEKSEQEKRKKAARKRRMTKLMSKDGAGVKGARAAKPGLEAFDESDGGASDSGGSSPSTPTTRSTLPAIGDARAAARAAAEAEAEAEAELEARIKSKVAAALDAEDGPKRLAKPQMMSSTTGRARRGSMLALKLSSPQRQTAVQSPKRTGSELKEFMGKVVATGELSHVTQAEAFEYHEIFDIIDLDHGGTIDRHELEELLDLLSMDHTQAELDQLMEQAGTNEDDEVPFQNFLKAVTCKPSQRYNRKMVLDAFQEFEVENLAGYIHTGDMAQKLHEVTGKSKARCTELLHSMGGGNEEFVHYSAFVNLCLQEQSVSAMMGVADVLTTF
jgi:Ca2+-binding EF-hand superfamily protein